MHSDSQRKKIAVLMATFNGERNIKEQINSILNQKDASLDLFFRDDGSDDLTPDIIQKYVAENENVFVIESNERLGAAGSFLELMNVVPTHYNYYAFADQDDIWQPDKLSRCSNKLDALSADEIGMAYCGYSFIDENGNPLFRGKTVSDTKVSWKTAVIENPAAGFSILMNRSCLIAARLPAAKYKNVRMHDYWVHQVAFFLGRTEHVRECLVNYRIHEANTVGIKKNYLHLTAYRKALVNYTMLNKQLELFLETFRGEICATLLAYLEAFSVARKSTIWSRLRHLERGTFWFGRGVAGTFRKVLFLLGK